MPGARACGRARAPETAVAARGSRLAASPGLGAQPCAATQLFKCLYFNSVLLRVGNVY